LRENGQAFYGPYLEEFARLTPEDQFLVAQAIYSDAGQAEADLPEAFLDLVLNLRVPEAMIQAVLEEAEGNEASAFFEIP
jgi:hypothetical protein